MVPRSSSKSCPRRDGVEGAEMRRSAFSSLTQVTLRRSIENTVFLVTAFLATRFPPMTLNSRRRGT